MSSHLSPLTLTVVGAPQMTLQQYISTFPCLPLHSGDSITSIGFILCPSGKERMQNAQTELGQINGLDPTNNSQMQIWHIEVQFSNRVFLIFVSQAFP